MSARLLSERRGSERLADRRRKRRRNIFIAFFILLLLLLAAAVYGIQQPAVRISHIQIVDGDPALASLAQAAMQGTYIGLIPRDSTLFFPASAIRSSILEAHPDIAAVSISRDGLTGLTIRVVNHVPIARWCGSIYSPQVPPTDEGCYYFDDSGLIFAATSTQEPLNPFTFYEPLTVDAPLGATLPYAAKLPAAFNFARQLATFGSPVTAVALHDGEVDAYLESGTRITYVLGHEQDAFTALTSAGSNINLQNGSIEYVDLRFDGKVYLKKKSVSVPQ